MADAKDRRAKITPENREEAARLKAIWDSPAGRAKRRADGFYSQEAFGAEYKIGNQAAVSFFLLGESALSFKAASGFARGLGCKISDFSPRLAALGDVTDAEPALTESPSATLALRLANAFAAAPETFADGSTKLELYNQLMGLIRDRQRPVAPTPTASALHLEPKSEPAVRRRKPRTEDQPA